MQNYSPKVELLKQLQKMLTFSTEKYISMSAQFYFPSINIHEVFFQKCFISLFSSWSFMSLSACGKTLNMWERCSNLCCLSKLTFSVCLQRPCLIVHSITAFCSIYLICHKNSVKGAFIIGKQVYNWYVSLTYMGRLIVVILIMLSFTYIDNIT